MSTIRSLGMPALRPASSLRQTPPPSTRPAAGQGGGLDGFDSPVLRSLRQAVIGGGNGPINVGPVFGDSGLPAPKGIIGPTGPSVTEPGVVAPVQDNTLAPKVPEAGARNPGDLVNENTQPPGGDAVIPGQEMAPPVQGEVPAEQNTRPPVQNAAPPAQGDVGPGKPAAPGAPAGPQAPGAVDGVTGGPGLDAQSLDELVTALVQVIDELVKQLAPGAAEPSGGAPAPKGADLPSGPTEDLAAASADSGLVSFSIRASAHFVISG